MKRSARIWVAVAGVAVLAATGLFAASEAGTRVAVRRGLRVANDWMRGSVEVGTINGTVFTRVALGEVVVRDSTGASLIAVREITASVRLLPLLRRRFLVDQITVVEPRVRMERDSAGAPFGLLTVLPPRADSTTSAPPLIEIRNARLTGGTLTVAPAADRGWTVAEIDAAIPLARLSSPDPAQPGQLVRVERIGVLVNDPHLDVTVTGAEIRRLGDSIVAQVDRVTLPASDGKGAAWATTRDGQVRWGADVDIARLSGADVPGVIADLPPEFTIAGRGSARRAADGDVTVTVPTLDASAGDAGSVRGQLGVTLRGNRVVALHHARLTLAAVRTDRLRPWVDSLPVHGAVSGVVAADGPVERLRLDVEGSFADRDVPGARSLFAASGLFTSSDTTLSSVIVRRATIDLRSLQARWPAVTLLGMVTASGEGTVTPRMVEFTGEVAHRHGDLPESTVRGTMDVRRDAAVTRFAGELELDSLRLTGLAESFGDLPWVGTVAGRVRVEGTADSASASGWLGAADVGRVEGGVVAAAAGDAWRVVVHDTEFRDIDVHALRADLPPTTLGGSLSGRMEIESDSIRSADGRIRLGRSAVDGVVVDSGVVRAALTDSTVRFDSLEIWSPSGRAELSGALGRAQPVRGTAAFDLAIDSLGPVRSLVERWIELPGDTVSARAVRATGAVTGSLQAFTVDGEASIGQARWENVFLDGGEIRGRWTAPSGEFRVDANADSLRARTVPLWGLQASAAGRADSAHWRGQTEFGAGARWRGGGHAGVTGSTATVRFDSTTVDLRNTRWELTPGAMVARDSLGLEARDVTFTRAGGGGRVGVEGRLPGRRTARLSASVREFPIHDLWRLSGRDSLRIAGFLNADVVVEGTAEAPAYDVEVEARDVAFGSYRTPAVTSTLRYAAERLEGVFAVQGLDRATVEGDLSVPVDLRWAGAGERLAEGALRGTVRVDGADLAAAEPFLEGVVRPSGRVDGAVEVSGTWTEPALEGRATVGGAQADLPGWGVRYQAGRGAFRFRADSILIDSLVVTSGNGSARVTGGVALPELGNPVLDLAVALRDFRAIDRPELISATATGDFTLRGPTFGATLTGRATMTRGALQVRDLIGRQIVQLDDTLYAQFVDTTVLRQDGIGPTPALRFREGLRVDTLRFQMGRDVRLRSEEVDVQLTGEIIASKIGEAYQATGVLNAPRGTYRLHVAPGVVREFTVTRGAVTFFGTPDLNADLDIDARHVVRGYRGEDVAILVHIGGTVNRPTVTLSSEDRSVTTTSEIVSYLLFGTPSVQAFAGSGGNQRRFVFQQSVDQLAGILSGQLQRSVFAGVGLDYLQIRPGDIGEGFSGTEIAIGKHFDLFDRPAFLTASPRLCPRQGIFSLRNAGASLESWLHRNWLLAASIDPRRACETYAGSSTVRYQFGLDVFWERRY